MSKFTTKAECDANCHWGCGEHHKDCPMDDLPCDQPCELPIFNNNWTIKTACLLGTEMADYYAAGIIEAGFDEAYNFYEFEMNKIIFWSNQESKKDLLRKSKVRIVSGSVVQICPECDIEVRHGHKCSSAKQNMGLDGGN